MSGSELERARSHHPRLVMSRDVHEKVHGTGAMGHFNQRLAVAITSRVGTMWTAYLFGLLALISLPAALTSGDVIVIVSWIAQTFLQLVLLPIIIVGQNVIQSANDARAEADHETLSAIHRLSVEIHGIDEMQTKILQVLERGKA